MFHHLRCWRQIQLLTLLAFATGSIVEPEIGLLRDGALHTAESATSVRAAPAASEAGDVPPGDPGHVPSVPHQHGSLADHCAHSHVLTAVTPFRLELHGAESAPQHDPEARAVLRSSPPPLHPPRA